MAVKVLDESLGRDVLIKLKGGKVIRGNLQGFDQHMNLLSKYDINSDFFYFINYWQLLETGFDHAGEVETSIMMAIHPNLVNMDLAKAGLDTKGHEFGSLYKLGTNMSINNPAGFTKFTKNGIWGNPLNAKASEGKKMLSQVIEKILSLITDYNYR